MIALGWTEQTAKLPAPFSLMQIAGLGLILAPPEQSRHPRQRLRHLHRCFDAGLTVLPLAAGRVTAGKTAERLSHHYADQLHDGLHRLSGKGQFTLRLSWPKHKAQDPQLERGGNWLWQSQRHINRAQKRAQKAELLLQTLVTDISAPSTQITTGATGCSVMLLIERQQADQTCHRLRSAAQRLEDNAMRLLITGLWPPFSFAPVLSDIAQVPA